MQLEGLAQPGDAPLAVDHDLTFTRSQLADVAARHRGGVEKHRSDPRLLVPSGRRTVVSESASQAVEGLDDRGIWLTLFGVQNDPELAPVAEHLRRALTSVGYAEPQLVLSVICSSAEGVTPAHMDVCDVLLLQLEGTKTFGTGAFDDPRERERETRARFGPARANLSRLPDQQTEWALTPGKGVLMPAYTPHWARVGSGASLALSVAITTKAMHRTKQNHEADAAFVNRGVRLPAPGRSRAVDAGRRHAVALSRRRRSG